MYESNNEGSFILEGQLPTGKWICLDATCRMNCFGRLILITEKMNITHAPFFRYINHSSSPNLKMHPPLNIGGKWRVGLVALCDIKAGEEICYHYGAQPNAPAAASHSSIL